MWLKAGARSLRRDPHAVWLAARDPRTPWYAKALAIGVVGYALSPIDLIPDFIPVVGYLDDLLLVPLGIALTLRLIPPSVLAESRERAQEALERGVLSRSVPARVAMAIIVFSWLLALALVALLLVRALTGWGA